MVIENHIKLLEEENKRKDELIQAAITDMKNICGNICWVCANRTKNYQCKIFGERGGKNALFCGQFKWRGLESVNNDS